MLPYPRTWQNNNQKQNKTKSNYIRKFESLIKTTFTKVFAGFKRSKKAWNSTLGLATEGNCYLPRSEKHRGRERVLEPRQKTAWRDSLTGAVAFGRSTKPVFGNLTDRKVEEYPHLTVLPASNFLLGPPLARINPYQEVLLIARKPDLFSTREGICFCCSSTEYCIFNKLFVSSKWVNALLILSIIR